MTTKPRKTPCASCPYRRDVPSGLWATSEYAKLETYDGSTTQQGMASAIGVFLCHQNAEEVCAGWSAVHGNDDNLALRVAAHIDPDLDVQAVLDYTTEVPLFGSGHEAAEHGRRDMENPPPEARRATRKIGTVRALRGKPVHWG